MNFLFLFQRNPAFSKESARIRVKFHTNRVGALIHRFIRAVFELKFVYGERSTWNLELSRYGRRFYFYNITV